VQCEGAPGRRPVDEARVTHPAGADDEDDQRQRTRRSSGRHIHIEALLEAAGLAVVDPTDERGTHAVCEWRSSLAAFFALESHSRSHRRLCIPSGNPSAAARNTVVPTFGQRPLSRVFRASHAQL